jgi:hypothetical protein
MKTFNITTSSEFFKMSTPAGNGLSIYIVNTYELYCRLDALTECCRKKFKKFGGLDLGYLADSSTLKSITRDARKQLAKFGESWTMQDDRQAREFLAYQCYENCLFE